MLTTQASHGRCENGGYQERIKLACGHIKNELSLGNWEDAGEEGRAFSEEKALGTSFFVSSVTAGKLKRSRCI